MYTDIDFKTKKLFREAVQVGAAVRLYAPGLGSPTLNGIEYVEGPHFPKPHTWYAQVTVKDGVVVKVK